MPVKPLLLVVLVLSGRPGSAAAADDPCLAPPPGAETVRLAGVDAAGDPLLADGRTLRFVGIAPRQDAAEAARFTEGLSRLRGDDLTLVPIGAGDRWGRQPARLLLPPETQGAAHRDLAALLIAAGAASRLPEAVQAGCTPRRGAARSVAGSPPKTEPAPRSGVVDGHDVAALKAQAGRLVVVEGRIASVGERAQRSYLNFSRKRGEAGAVTMSRKLWREMQAAGWTASGLNGKRLRATGVLSGQDGLLLEVTSTDAMELID